MMTNRELIVALRDGSRAGTFSPFEVDMLARFAVAVANREGTPARPARIGFGASPALPCEGHTEAGLQDHS